MSDPAAPFDFPIRVRYEETDRMGVVYHGKFFEYFEVGRTEWLRARGFAYRDIEARGTSLVVAEVSARYLAPAHYDDLLTIRTRLVESTRASLQFAYEVLRAGGEGASQGAAHPSSPSPPTSAPGEKLAAGMPKLVAVGPAGRPKRLPPEIAALL
jgi:acyl-CoA thioester hydrolase